MLYEIDVMMSLKRSIDRLNTSTEIMKRLAIAIEKQNELKERELDILDNENDIKRKTLSNNTRKFQYYLFQ